MFFAIHDGDSRSSPIDALSRIESDKTLRDERPMRPCEFCNAKIDESNNVCTECGATPSTSPTPSTPSPGHGSAPDTKPSALWLGLVFTPWLSGIAFFWIGVRANHRAWIAEGTVYMLPFISALLSSGTEPTDMQTTWAIIFWLVSIVRALKLKNEYNARMQRQGS